MASKTEGVDQHSPRLEIAEAGRARAESTGTVTLGLVPSPGFPERIANEMRETLTEELHNRVDGSIEWAVRIVADPVTGSDIETPDLLEAIGRIGMTDQWDYSIAVTDLPVRRDGKIVVADASTEVSSGWVSLPALGPIRMRRRTLDTILELMEDLHLSEEEGLADDSGLDTAEASRDEPTHAEEMVDRRFVSRGPLAPLRLISGMVYANEPWKIVPSFRTTMVTAVATGSYGLIFSSMWELGEYASQPRLVALMFLAITVLASWIIVAHNLWQPHRGAASQYLTTLYNTTTAISVGTGVVVAYALVYLVLLLESAVFMPPSLLEYRLEMSVDAFNYMTAAWVTSSVATLAGALGAGLEDTERVRRSTFSWRMRNRIEAYERDHEEVAESEDQVADDHSDQ